MFEMIWNDDLCMMPSFFFITFTIQESVCLMSSILNSVQMFCVAYSSPFQLRPINKTLITNTLSYFKNINVIF